MSVQDFAFFLGYQSDRETLGARKKPLVNSTSRPSLTLVLKNFESDYICLLKNMADHIINLQEENADSRSILVRVELDEMDSKRNCSCNLNQYLMSWSADNIKNMIDLSFKVTDHRQEPIKCTKKQSLSDKNRCDSGSIINSCTNVNENNNICRRRMLPTARLLDITYCSTIT